MGSWESATSPLMIGVPSSTEGGSHSMLDSDEDIPNAQPLPQVTLVDSDDEGEVFDENVCKIDGEPRALEYAIMVHDYEGHKNEYVGRSLHFLRDNPRSSMTKGDILRMRHQYEIHSSIQMRLPTIAERPDWDSGDWVCMYEFPFRIGFRFPFPPFVQEVLDYYEVAPSQLMPNAWRLLLGIEVIVRVKGKRVDLVDFQSSYYLKQHDTDKGRFLFTLRANKKAWVMELVPSNKRGWRKKYCFVKGDLFGTSDYEVPTSWRTLSKGLTRCPRGGYWSKARVNDLLSIPSDQRAHNKLLVLDKSCVGNLWRGAQRQEDRYYKRMTFKVCGADDAVARGKTNLLGKRSKKTTSHVVKPRVPAKEHGTGSSQLPADGVVANSPLRGDNELSIEESMINLSISSNILAYSDPASIEGHVEALLHPRDEERLRGIGVAGRANYGVSTIYQAIQAVLYLRRDTISLDQKNRALNKEHSRLRKEVENLKLEGETTKSSYDKLKQDYSSLNTELERVRAKLKEEEAKYVALYQEVDDISLKTAIKTRGELMIQYKKGLHRGWDVDGAIALHEEYLALEQENEMDVDAHISVFDEGADAHTSVPSTGVDAHTSVSGGGGIDDVMFSIAEDGTIAP
ncbi:uncharacterized protein LOC133037917 isoform X2 [Cannabis sativa]|uniref:uncharacterized protein LOC133037917 isoform X2 n=1 Tax=Cannabis sativa TaxID=3483 RepID=UPI0029C9B332|nr:uncharacterized protein LOC133037917 isoform X2 [Cannabis sativa]